MTEEPKKKDWLEKAKETFKFHRSKLRVHDNWTASLTAKELNRSSGNVSEDLKIARWIRKNGDKSLSKFDYAKDAIEFIREEERRLDLEDLE